MRFQDWSHSLGAKIMHIEFASSSVDVYAAQGKHLLHCFLSVLSVVRFTKFELILPVMTSRQWKPQPDSEKSKLPSSEPRAEIEVNVDKTDQRATVQRFLIDYHRFNQLFCHWSVIRKLTPVRPTEAASIRFTTSGNSQRNARSK
jgi:hypothetical protein